MNKKETKVNGIGFGIGLDVDAMMGIIDVIADRIGNKNDKGIYQNFTAITSWGGMDANIQIQKFENGKAVGKAENIFIDDFIDTLMNHDLDKLPDPPLVADKFVPVHLLEFFMNNHSANDEGEIPGLCEVCGFMTGLNFIPESRKFSRPDWGAIDVGYAYLMKTEDKKEAFKQQEVLFITSYQVSKDIFNEKTKNIKAKVVRLEYEGPDMTKFINAYDALNGVIVVVDMNSISAFQGATKYLTDIAIEMRASYNEDEVALYALNQNGFELILGQDRNKIVPEGTIISK